MRRNGTASWSEPPPVDGLVRALAYDVLSLPHDPVDQTLHGRNIADEPGDHATTPRVHLFIAHNQRVNAGDLVQHIFEPDRRSQGALLL